MEGWCAHSLLTRALAHPCWEHPCRPKRLAACGQLTGRVHGFAVGNSRSIEQRRREPGNFHRFCLRAASHLEQPARTDRKYSAILAGTSCGKVLSPSGSFYQNYHQPPRRRVPPPVRDPEFDTVETLPVTPRLTNSIPIELLSEC